MTLQPLDPRTLRDAFGAFPSGVVAVAASVRGQLTGIAASSFTSVSIDPPLVSFSISTTSSTWPLLREADRMGTTVADARPTRRVRAPAWLPPP